MTPQRHLRVRQVLDQRQPDLTVLMDNVHKPHNFSAVLRSCDAVGVFEAHAVWSEPGLQPLHHTSGGSARWVRVTAHEETPAAMRFLQQRGYTVYAANLSPGARDYRDCDYTNPSAILLGAELTGVSPRALALADQHISIPMTGMVESLNVSVAAAVILFEAQRQRLRAGLYETSRLAQSLYRTTLFEWLHPSVAAFCKRRGLDYPALDETGEIIDFEAR